MTVPVEAKRQSAAIDHLGALRRGLAWRRVLNRDMDMGNNYKCRKRLAAHR